VRRDCEVCLDAGGAEAALIHPRERAQAVPAGARTAPSEAIVAPFELGPLPPPRMRNVLRPSSAGTKGRSSPLDAAPQRVRDAETARREGVALHALLQHLVPIAPELRDSVGLKALGVLLPDSAPEYQALLDKALGILRRQDLQRIFGANSRAELPIAAALMQDGREHHLSGRIDRLVVEANAVLIVDYKSDAAAPISPLQVPRAYLTQLALYALVAGQLFPDVVVEAAILWTGPETLMKISSAELATAGKGFTIR